MVPRMRGSEAIEGLGDAPALRPSAEHRAIQGGGAVHFNGAPLEVPARVVAEPEPELMRRGMQLVVSDVHLFPDAILVLATLFRVAQRQVDGVAIKFHKHSSYDRVVGGGGVHRDKFRVVHVDYRPGRDSV